MVLTIDSFLYSNNFIFKNDVTANVIITKKKKKKIWDVFQLFWARGTKNWINTGQSINHDQVEIST